MDINPIKNNTLVDGLNYFYKGSTEFVKEYLVIDFLADSIIHFALHSYISFFVNQACISSCCSKANLYALDCAPKRKKNPDKALLNSVTYFISHLGLSKKQTSSLKKALTSSVKTLSSIKTKATKIFHFHGQAKIIGVLSTPIVYSLHENTKFIWQENLHLTYFAEYICKIGSYLGINPYESIFAIDKLLMANNSIAYFSKSFVSDEMDKRTNDKEYNNFMKISETWMESFVDAYEHGKENLDLFYTLFESEITNPYHITLSQLSYKLGITAPLILIAYFLNTNTQEKEKYLENLYQTSDFSNNSKELSVDNFSPYIGQTYTETLGNICLIEESPTFIANT